MAGLFPTRRKPFWLYMPLVSIASLFWWMTGLGLWVHYSQIAYTGSQDVIYILKLTVHEGAVTQIDEINSSVVATSVTFSIIAVCIHALGIYRGLVESKQDTDGEVDRFDPLAVAICNVSIQVAWWMILLWMIIMMAGFGAFSAFIYITKTALANTLVAMALMPPGPIIPGFCPMSCLDIVSLGIFIVADQEEEATFCLCDQPTLQQASNVSNAAHDAVPGMLVGLMLMVAYGIVLLSSMVGMLVRSNVEQGVSDRMAEQGILTVAGAKVGGGRGTGDVKSGGGRDNSEVTKPLRQTVDR